jgi:hypothetical protein
MSLREEDEGAEGSIAAFFGTPAPALRLAHARHAE